MNWPIRHRLGQTAGGGSAARPPAAPPAPVTADAAPGARAPLTDWRLDAAVGGDAAQVRRRLIEGGFHVKLADAVAYWHGLHHRGQPPHRSDIDPERIRSLLPCVALLDDRAPGGAPRWRLAGTAVVDMLGCEPTGRPLAAVDWPLSHVLLESWARRRSAAGRAVRLRDGQDGHGGLYQYECAFLPLADATEDAEGKARVLLCLLRRFVSDALSTPGGAPPTPLARYGGHGPHR